MKLYVGTSGYSYKEWKGSFYPEDLASAKMLPFYAERLNAVEINATFYRMPKHETVRKWAEQVPEGFSFVLKASQRITHKKRLKDCADELGYVVAGARELGAKLGPMLFQLPPYLKKDVPRLADFLAQLPEGWRAAFEFRHDSWFDDAVYDALRGRGAALVVSDTGKGEAPVVATTSWGYLRLRREQYPEADLETWAATAASQPWEEVYAFFKHEDAGAGPRLAADFRARFC